MRDIVQLYQRHLPILVVRPGLGAAISRFKDGIPRKWGLRVWAVRTQRRVSIVLGGAVIQ